MKFFRDQKGFSLVEILVVTGIAGAIGIAVSTMLKQQSDLKRSSQDLETINQTFKQIQSTIRNNANCETIFAGGLTGDIAVSSLTSGSRSLESNTELSPTVRIRTLSSRRLTSTTGRDKVSVQVDIVFQMKQTNGNWKDIRKSFIRPVVVLPGGNADCENVDANYAASESMRTVCNALGGTLGGGGCDMGSMNTQLQEHIRSFACQMFGANLSSGVCDGITVSDEVMGANIDREMIEISGQRRTQFDSSSCGGQYLSGMNQGGERFCAGLQFDKGSGGSITTTTTNNPVVTTNSNNQSSQNSNSNSNNSNSNTTTSCSLPTTYTSSGGCLLSQGNSQASDLSDQAIFTYSDPDPMVQSYARVQCQNGRLVELESSCQMNGASSNDCGPPPASYTFSATGMTCTIPIVGAVPSSTPEGRAVQYGEGTGWNGIGFQKTGSLACRNGSYEVVFAFCDPGFGGSTNEGGNGKGI